MSNPVSWINQYVSNIQTLISTMEALRTMNDELTQDSTIPTRYFASSPGNVGGITYPRADIAAADITNAQAALVQLLFTFDSGNPTQKSYLFKVLP